MKHLPPFGWMSTYDLVFENALTYNKDRKETQFVVKFARDMIKLVNREKENKSKPKAIGEKKTTGLKLKLSAPKKPVSVDTSSSKTKVNLKLKQTSTDNVPAGKSKASKPKLKLTLSMNKATQPLRHLRNQHLPPNKLHRKFVRLPKIEERNFLKASFQHHHRKLHLVQFPLRIQQIAVANQLHRLEHPPQSLQPVKLRTVKQRLRRQAP
mmetsp:Transcript_30399/g.44989  ORF Transcript_30399/g.44989 Transcript_30399/m.44989 type:complete len:210 (+) Transcript_30399:335-964(+)